MSWLTILRQASIEPVAFRRTRGNLALVAFAYRDGNLVREGLLDEDDATITIGDPIAPPTQGRISVRLAALSSDPSILVPRPHGSR